MIRFLPRWAAVAFALCASPSIAQQTLPFDLPPPYDGAYFDPNQPGIGLWLDNGPDGTTFGALMYYASDGRPTFATFAARLDFTGSIAESFTGVRGLRGPLWQSVNGQCLGCPWRAPQSSPLPGTFLTQIGHRDARVTYAGSSFQMGAIPLGRTDQALLEGTWWLALDDLERRVTSHSGTSFSREVHELMAVVRIVPVQGLRFTPPPGDATRDPRYPGATSIVHAVDCITSCGDFDAWRRASGETTRVFAFGSGAISPFVNASFGRWVDGPDGYVPAPDTVLHNLKLDPWAMHSVSTSAESPRAPRLALYRSPVTAPCDGGAACAVALGEHDAVPEYRSTGDGRFVALSRGLSGAFLDPAQPGTGLWIDVGHDDNTFMTLMTYAGREDGGADPVFYTLGGPIRLQPSGILGIAGVASPLYESRDGQRIDGAWRAPTTRVATELGTASVVLVSQDVVRLDVAGRTYRMVALRPDRAATDIPRGRWLLTLRDALVFDPDGTRPPGMPATVLESVTAEVQVTPNTMSRGSGSEALPLLVPSPAARTFAVACSASCGDFDAWRAGHELALWVEPDGIAVMSQVARQVATGTHVPASARQYRLVLHDDAIDGFGTRLHLPVDGRTLNRGELRMYRNPPQAFCDTDAACF